MWAGGEHVGLNRRILHHFVNYHGYISKMAKDLFPNFTDDLPTENIAAEELWN